MVSLFSTSKVMVLPVRVFTKICIFENKILILIRDHNERVQARFTITHRTNRGRFSNRPQVSFR
ncbi:hypothetical protein AhnVgp017 [Adoxophyes honmai nucleopolyhedrovirus]|uniref:Uncharacterized protein n=1 Tax=Adoxophyes honmai nucleopolyhedrovirus TaxID=224399 RepID=Q80LS9_NPVAH|nr:hypothetical protein AhnVgp017 [Adoxophyes honmai nucleopolyhedrovirus]BAC67268.1 hypothetical protein [Adoxophyes honmai nucleopolyhedrovirus]